jgi:hypothetical protein
LYSELGWRRDAAEHFHRPRSPLAKSFASHYAKYRANFYAK